MTETVRYAVLAHATEPVADTIAACLQIVFEGHESAYWGPYELSTADRQAVKKVRVYLNRDPMFDAQTDPAEERFFNPRYQSHGVLVETSLEADEHQRVLQALSRAFPGSEVIGDA